MLRPEQMSRVSVTGSKRVMDDVVETVHDLNLLHVVEYDGAWEGFEPGDPVQGADEASDKLVTVRSLQSILGVEEDDAGPSRIVTDEAIDEELEEIRQDVNDLDDEREELEDELRSVEERIDAVGPFADLGIDLDLLAGYEELTVAVGEGDAGDVRETLARATDVDTYEVFSGGGTVAVFAHPADAPLQDALVGAQFTAIEIPDAEGSPEEYVSELRHRKQQLESDLDEVEDELENLRLEVAGFLLAAEEKLAIEVQKQEAPLTFATTENAFVAEGWIPTEEYTEFSEAIRDAVGEHVEVDELSRASYTSSGRHHEEPTESGEVAADGGTDMRADEKPPVIQDNPGITKPFEVFVRAVGSPEYTEFDPTIVLFLTFPLFFGLMIGDFGYGLVYAVAGYFLYARSDNDAIRAMGGVGIASGVLTMVFGILYGEIFGFHAITRYVWVGALGMHGPILEKGLMPATAEWATMWLFVSVLLGIIHLDVGFGFDFFEVKQLHDLKHAVLESGSWLLMLNGLWVWIFSKHAATMKPDFLYTAFASGAEAAIPLGYTGLPVWLGLVGAVGFFLGLALLIYGEPIEAVEFLNVLVNALSYTRLAAEVLAEVGIAFTVNLLFFGAYTHEGEFHYLVTHGPAALEHGEIMFPGLLHMGPIAVLFGIVLLVLGHVLVLALGVLSAGMQAIRLEYVEFFGKFYQGDGRPYDPFGYVRRYTTAD
ncbi:MAG: V-type ATP synthase subunit I [Haloarculaceae archaeon]